jgi:type IV pilus assembly protein PilY1
MALRLSPSHESGDLVYGGVIADLNGSDITNARRFYNEPDVALIVQDGERHLSVSIGSGWRAHPLNTSVVDRFYMVRQSSVFGKPAGYGKNQGSEESQSWTPLTESDLSDVTDDLEPDYNPHGWYIDMEGNGEKVLGGSITVNNQVIFTSYKPEATGDPCSPAIGGGAIYVLDVRTGAPTLDLDGSEQANEDSGTDDNDSGQTARYDNDSLTKEDRKRSEIHRHQHHGRYRANQC